MQTEKLANYFLNKQNGANFTCFVLIEVGEKAINEDDIYSEDETDFEK